VKLPAPRLTSGVHQRAFAREVDPTESRSECTGERNPLAAQAACPANFASIQQRRGCGSATPQLAPRQCPNVSNHAVRPSTLLVTNLPDHDVPAGLIDKAV